MSRRRELFECPHCGADVPVGRTACPECGSDAGTGWQSQEEIDYQATDLPEGYAEAAGPRAPPRRGRTWQLFVVLLLALGLVLLAILS